MSIILNPEVQKREPLKEEIDFKDTAEYKIMIEISSEIIKLKKENKTLKSVIKTQQEIMSSSKEENEALKKQIGYLSEIDIERMDLKRWNEALKKRIRQLQERVRQMEQEKELEECHNTEVERGEFDYFNEKEWSGGVDE